MRKRTILLISIGVFGALCWTATTLVCAVITGHRLGGQIVGWAEQTVLVERESLEAEPGVTVLDANNSVFEVLLIEPNRVDVNWSGTKRHMKEPTCRVKRLGRGLTRVMGKVNGKEYPVIVDSGMPYDMIVNDVTVLESGLAVYPVEVDSKIAGLCHICRFEIGDMVFTNPPCLYELKHYERKLFGRTKWVDRDIIVGLPLMTKNFKYILIDGVAGEVEFCGEGSFEPDSNESWPHYAMRVERNERNVERLMVTMPLAGEKRKVMLDTGADCGMLVCEKKWRALSAGLEVVKQSRDRARMRDGWKRITVVTVADMDVGERSIEKADVSVMADEDAAEEYFLLGMGYFADTAIVLDFKHGLLWVKAVGDQAFGGRRLCDQPITQIP